MINRRLALDTIEDYYRLLKARDHDGLRRILSPDITVRYHGPAGALPWIGEFHGIAGFDDFLGVVASHLDIVEVERLDTVAGDRKVVVQARGCWRAKATGELIRGSMVNVFAVDNGRITAYEVYNDTLAFARGMRAEQRP